MSLDNRLTEDMKIAMKNRNKETLSVIRMVRSSLKNEAIKLGKELSEEEELAVLSREVKQRKESLLEFEKAGRDDLAASIRNELKVLEAYLPEQLSNDELEQIVKETIAEVGATSKADIGKVMGKIMPKIRGKADGSVVNQLVQQHLS